MSDEREFDVVLWGATGFAGQLVAEYLAEHYSDDGPRWAIAGRNREKLERLRKRLDEEFGGLDDLEILIGDSFDRESLDAIAKRTKVVCSTVGPYAKYGRDLVAACVEQGTDYCDLTGEVQFIREMIDEHHVSADESGVRIVCGCGFDSIPSDLGNLVIQDFALRRHGRPCQRVKMFVTGASGGMSGGTLASLSETLEQAAKDKELRRMLADPYALNPEGERSGPDGRPQQGVRYDEDADAWTGPFMMAPVNEKVVRRTNALLGYEWGRDFRYGESSSFGGDLKGALTAGGFTAGMAGFTGAMALKPTRRFLEKFVLPDPGEGPSRETIEEGYFTFEFVGEGIDEEGEAFRVEAKVHADSDPGYGATAVMIGESAVCLALNEIEDGLKGGVLTPGAAMGMRLVERLRDAGMVFEVGGFGD